MNMYHKMDNDMHTRVNNDMSMMYSAYAFGIYNKDTVSLYVLFPLWGSIRADQLKTNAKQTAYM